MFDGKFICTLTALIITVITICNLTPAKGNNTVEGFVNNLATRTTFHTVKDGLEVAQNSPSSNFFQPTPGFQKSPPERFENFDRSSVVKGPPPPSRYMASSARESFKIQRDSVKENYGCTTPSSNGPPALASDFNAGDYDSVVNSVVNNNPHAQSLVVDTLPMGTTMSTASPDGTVNNEIMYTRQIYSVKKDRNLAHGDVIRGDLPIMPCNTGWFQVSAQPSSMLQTGALFAIGGADNEMSKAMLDLQYNSSLSTTSGGVDNRTMSNFDELVSNSIGDVTVAGFV